MNTQTNEDHSSKPSRIPMKPAIQDHQQEMQPQSMECQCPQIQAAHTDEAEALARSKDMQRLAMRAAVRLLQLVLIPAEHLPGCEGLTEQEAQAEKQRLLMHLMLNPTDLEDGTAHWTAIQTASARDRCAREAARLAHGSCGVQATPKMSCPHPPSERIAPDSNCTAVQQTSRTAEEASLSVDSWAMDSVARPND